MKRTYRKEVYEAHEMMRRSQVRRRIIDRHCRKFVAIGKVISVIMAIAIIVSLLIVNATSLGENDDLIEQAKRPAVKPTAEVEAIDTRFEYMNLTDSIVKYSHTPSIGEDELAQELHPEDFPYYNNEEEAEPVIDLNKPNEEKVEEQPEIDTSNSYIPTGVTTTDEYPQIKSGFPAPPDDSYYTYTQEDYEYLLMTIVGEAQNCSKLHQMYVGSVVLNRLHNEKYFSYGDSIKDIVLAPNQYTCFAGGGAYRTPTELNIEVAKELIENGSILPANVIFQAEFKQGEGVYEQIGNTYFCYKN